MQPEKALFWVGLLILWIAFTFIYRAYRVDVLRQRLFDIRQKLFLTVERSDDIYFDDYAYKEMRSIVNGMIRFAHGMTFFKLLALTYGRRDSASRKYHKKLDKAFDSLPKPLSDKLRGFQDEIAYCVADHVVYTSVLLNWWLVPAKHVLSLGATFTRLIRDRIDEFKQNLSEWNSYVALEKHARDSEKRKGGLVAAGKI